MKKVIAMLLVLLMMSAPTISLGAPTNIIYNIINKEEKTTNNKKDAMEMLYSFKKKSAEAKEEKEIKPKDVKIIKNEKELDEVKGKKEKIQGTLIGIDVSKWNGDIDWAQVKEAGIQFVVIRAGYGYTIDKKFKRNIEGFNEVGIPVGVYIYTYAHDEKTAIEDAEWILEQIKPYKVDLPIVYDWENWGDVMEFKQSLWALTRNAKIFLDRVAEDGYSGMLYSSKNYLEKAWLELEYDTWLAHYTEQTTYQGKYKYWQLCEDGIIDGINGKVDIDVMYINK